MGIRVMATINEDGETNNRTTELSIANFIDITRYSNYRKLIRVTAYI